MTTTTTYFHGTDNSKWTPHIGANMTEDINGALAFAYGPDTYIYEIQVNESDLEIAEIESTYHDPEDGITYFSEAVKEEEIAKIKGTPDAWKALDSGSKYTEYFELRLLTPRAVAAAKVVARRTKAEVTADQIDYTAIPADYSTTGEECGRGPACTAHGIHYCDGTGHYDSNRNYNHEITGDPNRR